MFLKSCEFNIFCEQYKTTGEFLNNGFQGKILKILQGVMMPILTKTKIALLKAILHFWKIHLLRIKPVIKIALLPNLLLKYW